jgi:hypothetical protein
MIRPMPDGHIRPLREYSRSREKSDAVIEKFSQKIMETQPLAETAETQRLGRRTGRQGEVGDKETPVPLLPVSLSPLLLVYALVLVVD